MTYRSYTTLFLSDAEIKSIREYVPQALSGVQHLMVVEKEPNEVIGFMGAENSRLEMLFLSPSERGRILQAFRVCNI